MRCEDYPCCGHTYDDPCERQPYDEPGYFDLSRNPHALCEHEAGFCDVYSDADVYSDDEHEWDYDDTDENGRPWCYGCDSYAIDCDGRG